MRSVKTHLQIEIETAAGFCRAIRELANVANSRGNEIQRSADKCMGTLEATLAAEIEAWNEEDDKTAFPPLAVCAAADSWEPWADVAKCDVYMIEAAPPELATQAERIAAGLCPTCRARKAGWDEDEVRRGEM